MSVDYITWGRGEYKTSYHFQNTDDFDNKRSQVLNIQDFSDETDPPSK